MTISAERADPGPLAPYRVLDLTTERAWFTGKLLADLGADVIKVEPPGGDPGRLSAPFANDEPGVENSLQWWAYNCNKRSVTVALDTPAGRGAFLRLVRHADVVLESFTPGRLEELGLPLAQLSAVNCRVILTRITPFGQTGPYAQMKANDLILAAIGGAAWMSGDPDRAPLRTTASQYFLHAAAEGAVHTVAAMYHAARTGQGQQIDVSAQLATVRTLMNAMAHPHTDGAVLRRTTFGAPTPGSPYRTIYQCADGEVMASIGFGAQLHRYVGWLRAEHVVLPPFLDALSDEQLGLDQLSTRPLDFPERVSDVFADFFITRTKRELTDQALAHRLMFAPINTMSDIRGDPQLAAREYFQPTTGSGGKDVAYPTTWVHMSRTPIGAPRQAPRVGEHNVEIWGDLVGLAVTEIAHGRSDRAL